MSVTSGLLVPDFLNQFVELYEEIIRHEGYGDLHVAVRMKNTGEKEVVLQCGKEYRYRVEVAPYRRSSDQNRRMFKVVRPGKTSFGDNSGMPSRLWKRAAVSPSLP